MGTVMHWRARWRDGEDVDAAEEAVCARVMDAGIGGGPRRVLVPMSGASPDIDALRKRGHAVVAVDCAPEVARALAPLGVPETPERGAHDGFERHVAPGEAPGAPPGPALVFYRGDIFNLTPNVLSLAGSCDALFDRRAFDILPPSLYARYASAVCLCLRPGSRLLVVVRGGAQARAASAAFRPHARLAASPGCDGEVALTGITGQ